MRAPNWIAALLAAALVMPGGAAALDVKTGAPQVRDVPNSVTPGGAPGATAGEDVDLELVLAADVSRSIDDEEFRLQRQGYAAALTDRRVLMAIRANHIGKIALCVFEWSGEYAQRMLVDWTVVADEESAAYVAGRLLEAPRPFAERTAIGAALEFAMAQFARSGHKGQRRTIDVSGDGTNTNGIEPASVRDRAVAAGIAINGLVILSPEPMTWNPHHTHPPGGLPAYYMKNVTGGPGSFVLVVEDHKSFVQALTSKLIREIAGGREAPPTKRHAAARAAK
jgi:hypothetical protein